MIFFSIAAKVTGKLLLQPDMTHILQIDTSAGRGTVALTANGEPVAVIINEQPRDHAAAIHRMTEEALAAASISLKQLRAIAVCAGPGSYTGLRIGLAAAKGFCYALDIPLILHNKLTLLAHQVIVKSPPEAHTLYTVVCQARAGEYFAACYNAALQPVLEPQHIHQDQLIIWLQSVNTNMTVITDQENPETAFITNACIRYRPLENIDIKIWSALSYKDYENGQITDLATAVPFYMKDVYINKSK